MKTLLTAVILTITPVAAFAMGCSAGSGNASMSCPAGTTHDSATGTCVSQTTS